MKNSTEILCLQCRDSLKLIDFNIIPFPASNRYNSSFAALRTTIHNISDKKVFILILSMEELIAFILR